MADDLYVAQYLLAEVLQLVNFWRLVPSLGFFFVLVVVFRRRGYL